MTVVDDISAPMSASNTGVPAIVAKKPPRFAAGQAVVLRGYEDGWQWTVVSAQLLRRRNPFWSYTLMTVRPYDDKVVYSEWPEWKVRPLPGALL